MKTRALILAQVDQFKVKYGLRDYDIVQAAGVDRKVLDRLRAGKGCNIDTADRLFAWLDAFKERVERDGAVPDARDVVVPVS